MPTVSISTLGKRLSALLVMALALTACTPANRMPDGHAQLPPPEAPPIESQWQDYQRVLGSINDWQVQGKLGVRTPADSGSVTFNWKQLPEQFAIYLNGPLGQGTVWIRGNEQQVSLEQSGQDTLYAPTPELLMYNTMGWWLPVSDLHYWVKGIPSPHTSVDDEQHNADGTLQTLQQNGWQLSYPAYQQLGGWHLPSKVVAQYRSPNPQGDIRLTFIIKDWRLHSSP